jgi:hypothetical protein
MRPLPCPPLTSTDPVRTLAHDNCLPLNHDEDHLMKCLAEIKRYALVLTTLTNHLLPTAINLARFQTKNRVASFSDRLNRHHPQAFGP